MFQLLAIAFFAICCAISVFEAIAERDWPRDTFKLVIMSGAVLLMALY